MNAKKLVISMLIISMFLILNIICAGILAAIEPSMDYVDAFYTSMTCTTTVGFGNVAPETKAGKIFISFYELIPISLFFFTIGYIY